MKFSPCIDECTHEGSHCKGCGRPHDEVAETKQMVMALVNYARTKAYQNPEEFGPAIGKSISKKLQQSA
ncbi:MAG: DUF1289 domain-containing protein [Methylococcales bacterium]|nr:DUF1289 domain-containing protein [Methylococcales bacterium]